MIHQQNVFLREKDAEISNTAKEAISLQMGAGEVSQEKKKRDR